ncbi:hypothetical protein BCV69DRAFT_283648, partial [Microstroma glucosiphilum]
MAASAVSLLRSTLADQAAFAPRSSDWQQRGDGGSSSGGIEEVLQGNGLGMSASAANSRTMRYQKPVYQTDAPSAPEVVFDILSKRQAESDSATVTTPSTTTEPLETASGTVHLPTGVTDISGQPSATSEADARDNLLAIMPAFVFSMPAQILVTGINIALVSVIAVHLLFTVQYHLPLSRDNWILQMCSTLMLLVSLIVYLSVVFSSLQAQSHTWPYTFDYLAAAIPPTDGSWSTVRCAFYLIMRALTTLLIHLTHIQYLTLLYPSALEARLILWMLGPLAVIAAGMEFTALSPMDDVKTSDLGDAIRNICNSTLTLLYSCALLIWGGLVNRRRAWRSDGGTASFGGGAMGLAIMNTVMSFVQIRYDRLWWLPDICWTLTLWQSWLGFWWWVGAGMGIGEVEDREERAERRRKRLERQKRKAENHNGEEGSEILTGFKKLKDRLTGDSSQKTTSSSSTGGTLSRRRPKRADSAEDQAVPASDSMELQEVRTSREQGTPKSNAAPIPAADGAGSHELTNVSVVAPDHDQSLETQDDDTPVSAAGSSATTSGRSSSRGLAGRASILLQAYTPHFIQQRMRRLRIAHAAAAARAADEQSIVRSQVLGGTRQPGLRAMMLDRDQDVSQSRRNSRATGTGSRRQSSATVGTSGEKSSMAVDGRASSASKRTSSALGLAPSASATSLAADPLTPNSLSSTAYPASSASVSASASGSSSGAQDQTSIPRPSSTTSGSGLPRDTGVGNADTSDLSDDEDGVWVEEEGGPHDVRAQPDGAERSASTSGSGIALASSSAASNRPATEASPSRQSLHLQTNNPLREEEEEEEEGEGEDEERHTSSSGSATEIAPGQQFTSWTWRGGLSKARLRDRRTY